MWKRSDARDSRPGDKCERAKHLVRAACSPLVRWGLALSSRTGRRLRGVVASGVVVGGLLVLGAGTGVVGGHPSAKVLGETLISSNCGSTSSFNVCGPQGGPSDPGPVIYPGRTDSGNLPITFYNPLNVGISVKQLMVTFTNTFPTSPSPACDPSAFTITGPGATSLATSPTVVTLSFSPFLPVPAGPSTLYYATLALTDRGNQNTCKGLHLTMSFTANGQYTASTTTALTSTPNPSAVGASVQLTATVSSATAGSTTPQGTATFNQCANPSCSSPAPTTLGTVTLSSGSASFTTSPLMAAGNYYFQAVYNPPTTPPTNTNWSTSSRSLTQVVQGASCVNIPTSGATVISGSYNGNYEVKNNTTLWLDGGTITGNVTVDAKGQLTTSGGSIKGNVTSAGGPVALQGTSVGGSVQTTNASLGLGPNTTVAGNVQPTGGAVLCSSGSTAGVVHIGNNVQIQQLGPTSNPVTICNTQIAGNLQYTSNAAPVVLGGSSGCTGDSMGGNLQVQTNTKDVTIGGGAAGSGYGNTTGGNIQVQSNTGGGTLTNNTSTGGNCQLNGNTPGIVGTANHAAKQNTCNATA